MSHSKFDNEVAHVLRNVGLVSSTKLTDSIQGSIWRSRSGDGPSPTPFVTKVTRRHLHENSISVMNDTVYTVEEDILLEQSILKFLTQNTDCPQSIVRFQSFFKTKSDYYLVMEDGGGSLFDFIEQAHKLIAAKTITTAHWKQVTKVIINQMIEAIAFIHSKNVCHFDISLENFVINDIVIAIMHEGESETIEFDTGNIQIKLCDFGLAKMFTSSNCMSSKFCGKTPYKSPEVQCKKRFDAKANDIWCLGVCIFMILTGLHPWDVAHETDPAFAMIFQKKQLVDLLNVWDIRECMDDDAIDLIELVFVSEEQRVGLGEIEDHPFVN
eukprot:301670_1